MNCRSQISSRFSVLTYFLDNNMMGVLKFFLFYMVFSSVSRSFSQVLSLVIVSADCLMPVSRV